MKKEDLIKVGNLNDRYNLILYKLKQNKNKKDEREIKKLEKAYPDNEMFEVLIISELRNRGLISLSNSEGHDDEDGNYIYDFPNLPKEDYTNENGIRAVNSGLFPSELLQKTLNKRFRNIQVVGIGIAAIGGLITIISFLYKYINHFVEKFFGG